MSRPKHQIIRYPGQHTAFLLAVELLANQHCKVIFWDSDRGVLLVRDMDHDECQDEVE